MRILTFNVQNLRLRRRGGTARLDGARDGDLPADTVDGAEALDAQDRRLTAAIIAASGADVVCLQEVFDSDTLDHFHDEWLLPAGAAPWTHRLCLPGNDGHGRDLAVLSRRPLDDVASHASLLPAELGLAVPAGLRADLPVFRRDCLRLRIGRLTLWLCHFKAPYPDADAAWAVRRLEAEAVRALIERRHAPDPAEALWLIAGDLNEPLRETRPERAIAPLVAPFTEDLLLRLPEAERWSYHLPETGAYARPDVLLASPALAAAFPDTCPKVLREGLGREAARFAGPRLPGVGRHRPHASDHAALLVAFPGL